jgi:hypothetical protein
MKLLALVALVLVLSVVAVQVGTAGAVAADETGLGFDAAGNKIVNTARNVWIPVVVVLAIIGLAAGILLGMRVAGFSFRVILCFLLLGIAATATGLATFFPGLVTSLTLL